MKSRKHYEGYEDSFEDSCEDSYEDKGKRSNRYQLPNIAPVKSVFNESLCSLDFGFHHGSFFIHGVEKYDWNGMGSQPTTINKDAPSSLNLSPSKQSVQAFSQLDHSTVFARENKKLRQRKVIDTRIAEKELFPHFPK